MSKIRAYVNESIIELTQKVSWPTWQELQSSSIVVLVASFIIAGIVFVMDLGFQGIVNAIYQSVN